MELCSNAWYNIFSYCLNTTNHFIGNADLITKLQTDAQLTAQKSAIEALKDLEVLFRYLTLYGVMDKVNMTNRNCWLFFVNNKNSF